MAGATALTAYTIWAAPIYFRAVGEVPVRDHRSPRRLVGRPAACRSRGYATNGILKR